MKQNTYIEGNEIIDDVNDYPQVMKPNTYLED